MLVELHSALALELDFIWDFSYLAIDKFSGSLFFFSLPVAAGNNKKIIVLIIMAAADIPKSTEHPAERNPRDLQAFS